MNNEDIAISVIIPSFNVEKYIRQCIESVLNQTLENIEILCMDAGSTDRTLEILKEYSSKDPRVTIFLSNKKSYGAQVNQGIINAKGEYISIIETDDYIDENMLQSLYDLSQFSSIDIVKSSFYHVYEDEEGEVKLVQDTAKNSLEGVRKYFTLEEYPIFLEGHPSIWAAIYKKKFLFTNNIFFNEPEGGAWVDNPFFYKTSFLANKIIYTNKPYYYYRESNPNSSSNNLTDSSIPMRRVLEMFEYVEKYDDEEKTFTTMLYRRLFRYIEIILENNDNDIRNLDYNTLLYLNKVLNKVDEDYVLNNLDKAHQIIYYQYKSPLLIL